MLPIGTGFSELALMSPTSLQEFCTTIHAKAIIFHQNFPKKFLTSIWQVGKRDLVSLNILLQPILEACQCWEPSTLKYKSIISLPQ